MKIVVNMIMGSMMTAFSKGLELADRSGLDPPDLPDVLDLRAIVNPMFQLNRPIKNSYPPALPLKHQRKYLRLALALGDKNALSMPVAAATNEAFKKARSMGLGELDMKRQQTLHIQTDRLQSLLRFGHEIIYAFRKL